MQISGIRTVNLERPTTELTKDYTIKTSTIKELGTKMITCRTEKLFWTIKCGQVPVHRYTVVFECEVRRLIMIVIGSCQGHGRQQVKTQFTIWFGVLNWFVIFGWF